MQIDRPPPRRSIDRAFRSIALHTRTRTRTYVRTHACSETATAIEFAMQKVTLAVRTPHHSPRDSLAKLQRAGWKVAFIWYYYGLLAA